MFLKRIIIIILFMLMALAQNAFCASNYYVRDLILDNSDRMVLIRGQGNYKINQSAVYVPLPNASTNPTTLNLINNLTTFTITAPLRYVVDIPNAILDSATKTYKVQNSSTIQSIQLAQFSTNPNVVRAVFTLNENADITKFKAFTNGSNVIVQYAPSIIDNTLQYKFYTPTGDMDKTNNLQNTSAVLTHSNSDEKFDLTPRLQTKYYLSQVSENSDGIILRGLGSISYQRAEYNPENTKATLIIDNAIMASKLENKTYDIPSSKKNVKATITLSKLNNKKIKLTIEGDTLRDYRFVVSPDGQSLFISHRSYIINTIFSTNPAIVKSYKITDTETGYKLFEVAFNQGVTYDVFELDGNFYLDINNLGDYNAELLEKALKTNNINISALKISTDKTRFIIPVQDLNFAYANVESNAKSIKVCFKHQKGANPPKTPTQPQPVIEIPSTSSHGVVIGISEIEQAKETEKTRLIKLEKLEKFKRNKDNPTISAMKKVVIDPGHGGADSGAIGGGIYEKTLNLEVAKMVQEKLTKKNVYVYMTRTKDSTLTLEERVNFSNELSPDIFVSIHTNSTVQEDSYGLEVHYFKDDSLELAKTIHEHFASEKNLEKWDTKDRGVIKSRFYVINHTEAPSILIEMGFISNLQERIKLITKSRQEEIADSITKGILEYLKVK